MEVPARILVFQTAFTGDVILTLPLIQTLHAELPHVMVDIVVVPLPAEAIANHPSINAIIRYDKKGEDRGLSAAFSLSRRLREAKYDVALIPHRSFRSAAVCHVAGIPRRIGFSTSAGRFLLTDVVQYRKDDHEIVRNLSLLQPLGVSIPPRMLPRLYSAASDISIVNELLATHTFLKEESLIAVAPGSVWATKRWLPERYAALCESLVLEGFSIALIGGREDMEIGGEIVRRCGGKNVLNAIGKLSVLQSAELISRCRVAVSNDSAPMHLAVAVGTPVVAIFGATVPEYGFAPLGEYDRIVQTSGLSCRPCAIHGGDRCPIKTFVCMRDIQSDHVLEQIHAVLSNGGMGVAWAKS